MDDWRAHSELNWRGVPDWHPNVCYQLDPWYQRQDLKYCLTHSAQMKDLKIDTDHI